MKTIDFSYFIERYNAGEMDEAEKEWFLKELEGNEELRKETELRKKTDLILKNQDLINLRNKLNVIEKKRKANTGTKKHATRINIKYIVAGSLILIATSLALLTERKLNNEEIINRFYKVYETPSTLRSDMDISNPDYELALEYYKVHDYRNAAIYFSKVIENEPGNMQSMLLNGVTNFEIQNYPEAKRSFGNVINDNNNLYIDHAQWYLALCYIKTGETTKAKDLFSIIKKSNSIYKKDAGKILRNL